MTDFIIALIIIGSIYLIVKAVDHDSQNSNDEDS